MKNYNDAKAKKKKLFKIIKRLEEKLHKCQCENDELQQVVKKLIRKIEELNDKIKHLKHQNKELFEENKELHAENEFLKKKVGRAQNQIQETQREMFQKKE